MHRSPDAARPFGSSSRAAQHQAAPKRPRLDDDTPRRAALAGNEQRSAAITDDGGSPSSVCHFDAVVEAPRATSKIASASAAPPRCGAALTGVKSPFRHIQLEARRTEHEAAFEAARGDGPRRQEALGAAHRDGNRLKRARMCLASIEEGQQSSTVNQHTNRLIIFDYITLKFFTCDRLSLARRGVVVCAGC